jgi:CheY-like chemotaxis protein
LREQAPHVRPLFTDNVHDALAHLKVLCEDKIAEFPRLVLLDLNVPSLTHGWHALTQLRTLYPWLPVLAMSSGSPDQGVVKKAYELGAFSFLAKPLELEEWESLFHYITHYWLSVVTLPAVGC